MTASELGEGRRLLFRIGEQLDGGAEPAEALRNGHRMCDKIRLPDRLLATLLVAWLAAAHKQGRDIAPMVGDARIMLDMFAGWRP